MVRILFPKSSIPKFEECSSKQVCEVGPFKTSFGPANALATGELVIDHYGHQLTVDRAPYHSGHIFVRIPCNIIDYNGNSWNMSANEEQLKSMRLSRMRVVDALVFSYLQTSPNGVWLPKNNISSVFGLGVSQIYYSTVKKCEEENARSRAADAENKLKAKLKKRGLSLEEYKKEEKERKEKEARAKLLAKKLTVISDLKLIQSHIENAVKNLSENRATRDEAVLLQKDGSKLTSLARSYRLQLDKTTRGKVLPRRR